MKKTPQVSDNSLPVPALRGLRIGKHLGMGLFSVHACITVLSQEIGLGKLDAAVVSGIMLSCCSPSCQALTHTTMAAEHMKMHKWG